MGRLYGKLVMSVMPARQPPVLPRTTETTRVLLTLAQGERENGGQEVDLPSSGVLAAGAVTTLGICNAGMYTWTAIFKAANGAVLGEVKVNKIFPRKISRTGLNQTARSVKFSPQLGGYATWRKFEQTITCRRISHRSRSLKEVEHDFIRWIVCAA